jgi:hypothetical protein
MKFEFFKKQSGKTKGALFLKQNKTSKTKSKFVLLASTKLTKTSICFLLHSEWLILENIQG